MDKDNTWYDSMKEFPVRDLSKDIKRISADKGSAVEHPPYYCAGRIEVIDFIEDQSLGFHLGNAVKYICRAGRKDPLKKKEDIEKAIWYLERHLLMMDREREER